MQPFERRTMAEVVRSWAEIGPDRTAYLFLGDGKTETARCTYSELDAQASSIAGELGRLNARGERALLIYPTCPDFVAALLGCFYAGTIAVPAVVDKTPRARERFRQIVRDAQSNVALTTEGTYQAIRQGFAAAPEFESLRWVRTDRLQSTEAIASDLVDQKESDLALIQYTSGSTSEPKGIAITHGNLMAANKMVHVTMGTSREGRTVTWLPIFHDLGLIGHVMQTAYTGGLCVMMPPDRFLENPRRWLDALSRFRATHTAAPNFGFEFCLRKTRDQEFEGLDLSSLVAVLIAAEPIRHSTVRRFEERFAPYGFSPKAFMPGYGLAEATLCVSGGPLNSGARSLAVDARVLARRQVKLADPTADNAKLLVGSGEALPGEELAIVDPETSRRKPENAVGEIWVAGPHVGSGYWNNREETNRVFGAWLADLHEGPYLRTGDLGFLRDGQLYITGRLKDLIIVRGTNHYPQDIELTVEECHPSLRPGCGAAIAVTVNDAEEVVVLQEVRDATGVDVAAVVAAIRKAVSDDHGVVPHEIALLPPGAILKTGSGKVARRPCHDAYARGQFPVLHRWTMSRDAPTSALRGVHPSWSASASDNLQTIVEECVLRALELSPDECPAADDDLTEFGLDSAASTELLFAVEKAVGRPLSMDFLANTRTISQLVEYLRPRL